MLEGRAWKVLKFINIFLQVHEVHAVFLEKPAERQYMLMTDSCFKSLVERSVLSSSVVKVVGACDFEVQYFAHVIFSYWYRY